jgi:hypothetical protein
VLTAGRQLFLANTELDKPWKESSFRDDDELMEENGRAEERELGELSLRRIRRWNVVSHARLFSLHSLEAGESQ